MTRNLLINYNREEPPLLGIARPTLPYDNNTNNKKYKNTNIAFYNNKCRKTLQFTTPLRTTDTTDDVTSTEHKCTVIFWRFAAQVISSVVIFAVLVVRVCRRHP